MKHFTALPQRLVLTLFLALAGAPPAFAALVWGYDGAGWTSTDEGVQTTGGISFGLNDDNGTSITAVGSATVSTGYCHVSVWQTATSAKMVVYSAAGALIATSNPVTSGAGTGLLTFTFGAPFAIVSGTRYYVYIVPNAGYLDVRTNNAGAGFSIYGSAITYASPEGTVPTPSTGNYRPFIIWLDGGGANGLSKITQQHGQ